MARWGMTIDLDKCTGCQDCVVACKMENNIPPSTQEDAERGHVISWMKMLSIVEGEFPDVQVKMIPMPCQHCDNPPCTPVCPVDATNINEEGIVRQIFSRCIGCRYCTASCPYTVRYFNWREPSWTPSDKNHLSPDVSLRPKGVVEKCTFCHHRLERARDQAAFEKREMRAQEYTPACVQSCPAKAMEFGDLDDPHSTVSKLNRNPRAFKLLEELGTEPKVTYLAKVSERAPK